MPDIRELSIITGAGKGIGSAIASRFAADGHNVILIARTEKDLKKVSEEIRQKGGSADYYTGDVGDPAFADKVITEVITKYGRIDHLINNAGFGIFKKIVDSSFDNFRDQLQTNVLGIYNFSKAVLPKMIEQRSGSIINISSLAGKNAFVGGAMYSATKHAVLGFTKSLMLEVREYNIRVSAICPGSVETTFGSSDKLNPMNKKNILLPEDVAEVVASVIRLPVRALASEIDLRPTNPAK